MVKEFNYLPNFMQRGGEDLVVTSPLYCLACVERVLTKSIVE